MKAILLSNKQPEYVELDDHDSDKRLDQMREAISCRLLDGAGYPDEHHACWADDEAVLNVYHGMPVFNFYHYGASIAGNVLITGFDQSTGETTGVTMTLGQAVALISQYGEMRENNE